jgi:omega-6 fatty acid desaturase / acyl-lipid omega-6 desaturase (Delta-12 desaturase)
MGKHYRADTQTGFWTAFWKSQRECKFVEESVEGSGIYFFRNLYGKGAPVRDLTEQKANDESKAVTSSGLESKTTVVTAMASSRNKDAKRRFSQGLSSTLPLLAE